MVKIKRAITFILISIAILCCSIFAACNKAKYSFEEVKQEFSQYKADLNIAVVSDHSNLCFYDRTIQLEKMVPEENLCNLKIIDGSIYFSVEKAVGSVFNRSAIYAIYKCDLYGNNLVCLLRKENLDEIEDTFNGDIVYIQHKAKGESDRNIDSYNLISGEYKNIAHDQDCDINQYKEEEKSKKYSYEYTYQNNSKSFSVTDIETSEIFVWSDDYLKQSPYYKSMNKYPYEFYRINEYNGELYMVYRIKIEDPLDSFPDYTVVVFELDFASKELIYKSIVQTYDIMVYDIISI